jgi:hypothetical protein
MFAVEIYAGGNLRGRDAASSSVALASVIRPRLPRLKSMEETMRVLALTELMRLSRIAICWRVRRLSCGNFRACNKAAHASHARLCRNEALRVDQYPSASMIVRVCTALGSVMFSAP